MNSETVHLLKTYGKSCAAYWNAGFEPLVTGTGNWQYFDARRRINTILFRALLMTDTYNPVQTEYPPLFPGYECGVFFCAGDLQPESELQISDRKTGDFDAMGRLCTVISITKVDSAARFEFLDFFDFDSMGICHNEYVVARAAADSFPLEADQVIVVKSSSLLGHT
jgi:hypothetical protein